MDPGAVNPEIVSNYVLSRFPEPDEEVRLLIGEAADEVERLLEQLTRPEIGMQGRPAGEAEERPENGTGPD